MQSAPPLRIRVIAQKFDFLFVTSTSATEAIESVFSQRELLQTFLVDGFDGALVKHHELLLEALLR